MSYPLVHVSWVDSSGGGGWVDIKNAKRDAEDESLACESVGWLIEDNDRYVMVAGSIGGKQVCDAMQIPRCAVVRVRTLTPGRTRR